MDWTTLLAYLSGCVDEDCLRRNQQPAPHRQGRGWRVGDRLVMDAAGFSQVTRLTARWSCPTLLLRYVVWRMALVVPCSAL
jgi:hypothetical protein